MLRKKVDEELADTMLLLKLRSRSVLLKLNNMIHMSNPPTILDLKKSLDTMIMVYLVFGSQKTILIHISSVPKKM